MQDFLYFPIQDESEYIGRKSKGQKELEEELKKAKKRLPLKKLMTDICIVYVMNFRQIMLDNIGVVVATVIMVVLAFTIVTLKVKKYK